MPKFLQKIWRRLNRVRIDCRVLFLARRYPGIRFSVFRHCELFWLVDLRMVNTFWTLNLGTSMTNPFVRALKGSYAEGIDQLKIFYSQCMPRTLGSFMGCDKSSNLSRLPPLAANVPWRGGVSLGVAVKRVKVIAEENKREGVTDGHTDKSWQICGPCSEQKVRIEMARLTKVYNSISRRGYLLRQGDDFIGADILLDGSNITIYVTDGQHRLAALAAAGWEQVPLRILRIVQKRTIREWPGVIDGSFTQIEAQQIFDNLVDGKSPACTLKWLASCQPSSVVKNILGDK